MVYGAWVLWMGLIGAALARMIHNVRHLRRLDSGYEARADVSVIIPARNEAAAIADCVRSFANQTLAPAQILGVDDRLGSLEAGKDASFLVSDGDPLDVRSEIVAAWLNGEPVDLSSRHTRLRDRFEQKYDD